MLNTICSDFSFNISGIHISWKEYILIGTLSPKINTHVMAYKKKKLCSKLSTLENHTFITNS